MLVFAHGSLFLLEYFEHLLQHVFRIAYNGDVHPNVLADGGRVNVNVDNLSMRRKAICPAGSPVIKTRTYGDENIGLHERHIGGIGAVHAQHAEELRMSA